MSPRWIAIALVSLAACKVEPTGPPKASGTTTDPPKPLLVEPPAMTDSVAGLVGQAVKIEVSEQALGADPSSGKHYVISDSGKVLDVLAAIGGDQVPTGARRRCPDTITLNFVDAAGAGKAGLALCNTTTLTEASALEGPEVYAGEARGGVKLADEPALLKLLLEARASH